VNTSDAAPAAPAWALLLRLDARGCSDVMQFLIQEFSETGPPYLLVGVRRLRSTPSARVLYLVAPHDQRSGVRDDASDRAHRAA